MNEKLPTAKEFLRKFKKKIGLRSQVSPLGSEGMERIKQKNKLWKQN